MEQARRPTDVIGHHGAISLLDHSVVTERLSHAYIFVGPKHVGKMAVALHLAKAVNCRSQGPRPCLACSQCNRIASLHHPDVQVIDLTGEDSDSEDKTKIGIEKVRGVQRQASLHPYEGACRVFIVDGAELLTHDAANSLLKVLEEPPSAVLFLLLTTDESLVLPTILSRCQRMELRPMALDDLASELASRFTVDDEKARLLARLSGGCPGWAISAARDQGTLDSRIQALDNLIDLTGADLEERFQFALSLSSLHSRDRQAAQAMLELWASWWRDLILARTGLWESTTNLHRRPRLEEHSQRYSLGEMQEFIRKIEEAREYLEHNVNPRTTMEWLMLNLPRPAGPGA